MHNIPIYVPVLLNVIPFLCFFRAVDRKVKPHTVCDAVAVLIERYTSDDSTRANNMTDIQ